ncbi:MAG: four helix bundle protein [Terriglobia bacterium]
MRDRTKNFAIRIAKMFRALPKTDEGRVLGKQVLRSGTSVAANYRAVCRSRSRADFISKLSVVTEEIDETAFWLELLVETRIVPKPKMEVLLKEANELTRIFGASVHTARTG